METPDLPPVPLSRLAAAQFDTRQKRAAELVRNRGMARGAAEAALRPWAALACLAGCDLPEFEELLAERRETDLASGTLVLGEGRIRSLVASEIFPRDRTLATLAKARDAALNGLPAQCRTDSPEFESASGLNRLADWLGCPAFIPSTPVEARKAA